MKSLSWRRFSVLVVLLVMTAMLLHARRRLEIVPKSEQLELLPLEISDWRGHSLSLDSATLAVLGAGNFLSRNYVPIQPEPYVNLFVAYFPTQRAGDTVHSPQNCLPGSGWTPIDAKRIEFAPGSGAPFVVNRYIIAKGLDRQLVLYWYQAHGRRVASEYFAKFYLVADAIRMNRTDGAMVRLVTPILPGEGSSKAELRAKRFAEVLIPELDRFIPL